VFVVLYKNVKKPPASTLREVIRTIFVERVIARGLSTTPLERSMLSRLLILNSKRISTDYEPHRRTNEDSFCLSFLLPLGPISMQDLGKLTNNSGCAVCGDTRKSLRRCGSCQSIFYCSKGRTSLHQTVQFDLTARLQNVREKTGKTIKPHAGH